GIDPSVWASLARLAGEARGGVPGAELAAKHKATKAEPPFYSLAVTAAAVGAASGAFSFLNSGGPSEIVSAFIGGAVGQSLRSLLFPYRYNQYAVTALCAAVASRAYVLISHAPAPPPVAGGAPLPPGFLFSPLFPVPGFPLFAGPPPPLPPQAGPGLPPPPLRPDGAHRRGLWALPGRSRRRPQHHTAPAAAIR